MHCSMSLNCTFRPRSGHSNLGGVNQDTAPMARWLSRRSSKTRVTWEHLSRVEARYSLTAPAISANGKFLPSLNSAGGQGECPRSQAIFPASA